MYVLKSINGWTELRLDNHLYLIFPFFNFTKANNHHVLLVHYFAITFFISNIYVSHIFWEILRNLKYSSSIKYSLISWFLGWQNVCGTFSFLDHTNRAFSWIRLLTEGTFISEFHLCVLLGWNWWNSGRVGMAVTDSQTSTCELTTWAWLVWKQGFRGEKKWKFKHMVWKLNTK